MFILGLAIIFLTRILWALRTDFFIDEGFSGLMIKNNLGDIVHHIAADYNTFFHYVYLKGWASIFGNNHISLRLSSLFISALTLIVFYKITKFFIKQKGLRQATTLLAASIPSVLYYSFEVRMYGMESLWVLCSVYYICRAYQNTPQIKDVLFFACILSLGFYTQALFGLQILLIGIYIMCNIRHISMRKYLPAFALVAVSFMYWLGPMLEQIKGKSGEGWLQFFYWQTVSETQRSLFLFPMIYDGTSVVLTVSIFIFSIICLTGFWVAKIKPARFVLYFILGTHVLFFVLSPWLPMYYFRYMSYLAPLYILGFGLFLQHARGISYRFKVALVLTLTACCVYWVLPAQNVTVDARLVQPYLETYSQQGYEIVFESAMGYFPGKYYLQPKGIKTWIYAKYSDLPQYLGKVGIDPRDYLSVLDTNKKYIMVCDSAYNIKYQTRPQDKVEQFNRWFLITIE